jgi:riboflavin kinase / FMN adenylyltransferase
MEIFRGIQDLRRSLPHVVVTIGNFDGVHLGHRAIISLAIEKARARSGTAVAYTFRPHPQLALRPEAKVQLLTTYDEKLELLARTGIDAVVEQPFSREFSTTPPERFFSDVLVGKLGAEAIVVGYDFAFGKERAGHLAALESFSKAAGVELTVVPPQETGGEVVSSSRIRERLLAGDVESAARLLGRQFSYRGVVVRGDGRGRQLGYPTANLRPAEKLSLPYGVYATWAVPEGSEEPLPSVTSIGVRPTFQRGEQSLPELVECHLLDGGHDLYGRQLEVRFTRRLREERRFPGVAELKAQIAADIEAVRRALAP